MQISSLNKLWDCVKCSVDKIYKIYDALHKSLVHVVQSATVSFVIGSNFALQVSLVPQPRASIFKVSFPEKVLAKTLYENAFADSRNKHFLYVTSFAILTY